MAAYNLWAACRHCQRTTIDHSADCQRKAVEGNLGRLGLKRLSIVNLRMSGPTDDIATPMRVMRRLQDEGLLAPGTSRRAHLHDSVAATGPTLSEGHMARLNGIAAVH